MLQLRPRRRSDAADVVSWIPDAAALYLFTGPRLHWPLTEQQLIDLEQETGMCAWAMVDSGFPDVLLGHFDLVEVDDCVRIGRVILAPAQRGRGLAHRLMELAIERAREHGAARMQLNVIADNAPAIRTYERLGFERQATQERRGVDSMTLWL